MKVIIAGSRSIGRLTPRTWDYDLLATLVEKAVADSGYKITQVYSGKAGGIDRAGEQWAERNGIPLVSFELDKSKGRGQFSHQATEMTKYADAAILIHDGTSSGTLDTQKKMKALGKPVHYHLEWKPKTATEG